MSAGPSCPPPPPGPSLTLSPPPSSSPKLLPWYVHPSGSEPHRGPSSFPGPTPYLLALLSLPLSTSRCALRAFWAPPVLGRPLACPRAALSLQAPAPSLTAPQLPREALALPGPLPHCAHGAVTIWHTQIQGQCLPCANSTLHRSRALSLVQHMSPTAMERITHRRCPTNLC